jgi:hypothetical protein
LRSGQYRSRFLPSRGQTPFKREEKMSLGRRDFLAATGSAVVGLIGGSWSGDGAQARAPVSNSQAPGFYRFSLGQFQLTVVSDGTIAFPAEALWPEAPKAERDAVLASDFQPTDKSTLQVNVLAVNMGDRLVLIDAGSRGSGIELLDAASAPLGKSC